MKLTKQEIEDVARLARLNLTEEEKENYAEQLSAVLGYVELLNEVDTEGIEETSQMIGLEDIVREDETENCPEERRKKMIAQFPEEKDGLLKVHKVFE
ncbi:MAG: Asp-tRNA(Asn)/Glu-tRNA(Gln) amidotransferase GatCAB subunit C [Candidatus Magasanikbacteria bacterium CG_4_9_14_3_um_filter_32_9]|uniref:Aspartyl/glutamyl-tRNA(Asn/Gln) amidotransferase subunit C n=1 Tax=Candidatus Magasanikbacteria bacterium CG_4_9_14_3_um_filter_32_9 TaxID=1974644 RepID=A0A2M7Z715_9BACT|nr:MAG: Asp-tRNA(Asn)/Glu-tRNA(Gln) amidotransferase GatCAB subunit C [Candidatus Magasanikbacteria bacterium CG_4_9_14_3_um_filter_32_9]